jgi:hypothetical protein
MLRISDLKSRSKRFVYYMFCNTWNQLQQAVALTEMCLMDIAGIMTHSCLLHVCV